MEEKKYTILVVDDSAIMLRTMKTMLESEYNVMLATSASKAMIAMGKQKPDLIILDYEMPICDGKMALEMIRAEEELADIPVFFLTGIADEDHIKSVLNLHPEGYFLKPPDAIKILFAIANQMSKKNKM